MAEKSKVTRIKATDSTPAKGEAVSSKKTKASGKTSKIVLPRKKRVAKVAQIDKPYSKHWYVRFFQRIGRYFKGSWYELKQVRWPSRGATWGLTVAVLVFSGFFVGLIVLLDLGFNSLFEIIIK